MDLFFCETWQNHPFQVPLSCATNLSRKYTQGSVKRLRGDLFWEARLKVSSCCTFSCGDFQMEAVTTSSTLSVLGTNAIRLNIFMWLGKKENEMFCHLIHPCGQDGEQGRGEETRQGPRHQRSRPGNIWNIICTLQRRFEATFHISKYVRPHITFQNPSRL